MSANIESGVVKRGRGRPKKLKVETGEQLPKRGRGRPRKIRPAGQKVEIKFQKKARGRPKKSEVIESEVYLKGNQVNQVGHKVYKKVDPDYLVKHLLSYFTKLMIVHNGLLESEGEEKRPLFKRLKSIDLQMIGLCREVLGQEEGE